jgi:hypothetical protein
MSIKLAFEVGVIDPRADFVNPLEDALQEALPGHFVVGYRSSERFLADVQADPLHVPLLVIADSASRTPCVEEGLFARVRDLVPRCRKLLYSTSMLGRDRLEARLLVDRAIRSSSTNALNSLIDAVRFEVRSFEESVEFDLIQTFLEAVRATPHPDKSSVDYGRGALSPRQILIEMARGTDRGRRYLRDIHRLDLA